MKMKKVLLLVFLLLGAVTLTGCSFIEPGSISDGNPPGFLFGLWHGLIAPYSLLISWKIDIYMYAIPNMGWLYDAGFMLGITLSIPVGGVPAIIAFVFLMLG